MSSLSITVKNTSGARFEMEVTDMEETVSSFKTRLATVSGIPADSQRLIYRGHILKDQFTINEVQSKHGLQSGHSMHVVPAPSSTSRPPSTPTNPPRQTPSSNTTAAANGANRPRATANNMPSQQPMPNPFAAAAGGGTPGNTPGLPDMMEMHAQMMRNPDQLQAMLNSPVMDSIMNNPDIMRSFMMDNPQMRELIERNPEFAHVFSDPETFRQMMQMARNPSLMNEMMRNTDRQMANIEMMPGGFDALRRVHENIQAPLMDAAQGGFVQDTNGRITRTNTIARGTNTNADNNPFSSLFESNTPSNTPMPNPWAALGAGTRSANNTNTTTDNNLPPPASNNDSGSGSAMRFLGPLFGMEGMNNEQTAGMGANPGLQAMIQAMLDNPAVLRAVIASNPQFQTLTRSQPEYAAMLQNPEFLRAILDPAVLRLVQNLQNEEDLINNGSANQTGTAPANNSTTAPGGGGTTANANASNDGNESAGGTGAGADAGTRGGSAAPSGEGPIQAVHPQMLEDLLQRIRGGDFGSQGPGNVEQMFRGYRDGPGQNRSNTALDGDGGVERTTEVTDQVRRARALFETLGLPVPWAPEAPTAATGAATGAAAAEPSQRELQERYSTQLSQLRDMGFLDETMCLQALRQAHGDVNLAIENLLSRFGG